MENFVEQNQHRLTENIYSAAFYKCSDVDPQTWETVEEWEKRMGMVYPDDGPVWCLYPYKDGFFWKLHTYDESERIIIRRYTKVVANHLGKPPEDWRPE